MPKKYMIQCLEGIAKDMIDLEPRDFLPPTAPPVAGETVLMNMNDESMRLCTLWNKYQKEGKSLLESHESHGKFSPEDLSEEELTQLHIIDVKHNLVQELMWFSVRKQTNVFHKDVGIRSNWTIVTPLPENRHPLEEILRRKGLGGMGMGILEL